MVSVSVVIPTRDRHDLLQRAIASVAAQHVLPQEVIVVGDGCMPVVEDNFNLTIKTIETPQNTGGAEARNEGIRAATGDWIALLDDDDEWLPTKLERQLEFARKFGSNVVACRVMAATPSAKLEWPRRLPRDGEPLAEYLLVRRTPTVGETLLQSSMLLIRRELLLQTPFTTGLPRHQEWDWLIRAEYENDLKLGFVESVESVWHSDDAVMQITKNADWRVSLKWISSIDKLTGPDAARNFILTFMSRVAASSSDWKSVPLIIRVSLRYGRPSLRETFLFLLVWFVPPPNTALGSALRHANGFARSSLRGTKGVTPGNLDGSRRAVLIVQPYVAEYRVAFYEKLRKELDERGIDLWLYVGQPVGKQVKRSDAAQLDWVESVDTRLIRLFGKPIRWKPIRRGQKPDLIVLPHGSGWADNYAYMLQRTPIALWGQGKPYTTGRNLIDSVLERIQSWRARHYLVYTPSGADALAKQRWDVGDITVLNNTIDTSGLEAAVQGVQSADDTSFSKRDTNVCMFIGGLDETKRLQFLIDACDIIAQEVPGFELLVAGDGEKANWLLEKSVTRSWLNLVGKVGPEGKAQLAARSKLILMPGRVGLVAVDSFVLRCPIVTTDWGMHAPEYDYLDESNSATTVNDVNEYAATVSKLLRNDSEVNRLRDGCGRSVASYTVDAMVANFARGLQRAIEQSSSRNFGASNTEPTVPRSGTERSAT